MVDRKKDEKKSGAGFVKFPTSYGNGFEQYINDVYDATGNARAAQIEQAYNRSVADYQAARQKADEAYQESRRQATGEAARQQASFRELANAQGVNSGAASQAAVMQSNQLQNDLSAIGRTQASTMADIGMQEDLLRQNLALQKRQAAAENQAQRANAMYMEKVRMEEARRQQAQFDAQMQMQYMQMAKQAAEQRAKAAAQAAKAAGTGGIPVPYEEEPDATYENALLYMQESIKDGKFNPPMTRETWDRYGHRGSQYQSYEEYLEKYVDAQISAAAARGAY